MGFKQPFVPGLAYGSWLRYGVLGRRKKPRERRKRAGEAPVPDQLQHLGVDHTRRHGPRRDRYHLGPNAPLPYARNQRPQQQLACLLQLQQPKEAWWNPQYAWVLGVLHQREEDVPNFFQFLWWNPAYHRAFSTWQQKLLQTHEHLHRYARLPRKLFPRKRLVFESFKRRPLDHAYLGFINHTNSPRWVDHRTLDYMAPIPL